MAKRQLHLGAFMRPASIHTGAWRYPGAWPDMNFNLPNMIRSIKKLEQGKFDAFFMADHMAVLNMPVEALKRSHTVTSFEPFTLLSALSQHTGHIGLVATGSTTFDAPYHIARRFASLDHLSGGRAGWNIVTTSNPGCGAQFRPGRAHGARRALQARARILRRGNRVVGQLGRRRLRARRRERHLSRSRKDARARPQGQISLGARSAEHRAADSGLAGDRAGRRVRTRPATRRRDRRGRVHRPGQPGDRPRLLRRREGPRREGGALTRSHQDPAGLLRRGRRHGRRGQGQAQQARQPGALRQRHRLRSRSRSATMPRSSIPTVRCPTTSPRATPPRADASARSRSASAKISPCGSLRSGSAAATASPWSERPRPSPTRCRSGWRPRAPTASPCSSPTCPAGSTTSSTRWCRSCSGAASTGREYEGKTLRENLGLPRPANRFFEPDASARTAAE